MLQYNTTDQILSRDRISAAAGGYNHFGQALSHVLQAAGEGEDGHDLTRNCDVKLGLQHKMCFKAAVDPAIVLNTVCVSLNITKKSKPTSLVYPFSVGDWPMVIFLRNRSFVSSTAEKKNPVDI